MVSAEFWRGRHVLVTGHSGFKGGWLCAWLLRLGARVSGLALPPNTNPALFDALGLAQRIDSHFVDIRDADATRTCVASTRPEIIFHLAAQPLVRASYRAPADTFATNVLGTAHVLDASLAASETRAVIVITSDKCYRNQEWDWPYRENDALGGHDPYSASKAATEILVASYRDSFFDAKTIGLATARAGNVIGGGDWAEDRLIPDLLSAFARHTPALIRFPAAIRPWQHVLEPLAGYLRLAEKLATDPKKFSRAWNFGPNSEDALPVGSLADKLAKAWGGDASWHAQAGEHPHETGRLLLDSSRAQTVLGWKPRWRINDAIAATVAWHKDYLSDKNLWEASQAQIADYEKSSQPDESMP